MKPNKITGVLLIIILISLGLYFSYSKKSTENPLPEITSFDARNSTFTIESKKINLVNGIYSDNETLANSNTKIVTRYFGNEARGDLNFDGKDDISFLVSQDNGGSGLFYYVVVAYTTPTGYKTTNAFFIGDRIAPQTSQINTSAHELYVNYAERKSGEPFTARPSQGATKILKVTSDGILKGLMQ